MAVGVPPLLLLLLVQLALFTIAIVLLPRVVASEHALPGGASCIEAILRSVVIDVHHGADSFVGIAMTSSLPYGPASREV
uniref:Uncharacterized protein n=1 Tax=Oryza glumipatula TaxID=40148 RepID=A0A0E0A970_9ORYZ